MVNSARVKNIARDSGCVHNFDMRTNVQLADDAREFAEVYAYANGITLGDAITALIRKNIHGVPDKPQAPKFGRSASGFPTVPRRNRVLTTEMVLKAQEEEEFA